MGLQNNDRLAAIFWGFLFLVGILACTPSPPYDAIPAPVTQDSGDAELAELLNSIRTEERLPGLAAAIITIRKKNYYPFGLSNRWVWAACCRRTDITTYGALLG